MRVATLVRTPMAETEDRKRSLQRKEMDQAYKRAAKYTDKNPLLTTLEELISGKTEKNLYEKDSQPSNNSLDMPNPISHQFKDIQETIDVLQDVKQSALSSKEPTNQDLVIAARADVQIEQVQNMRSSDSEAPKEVFFEDEDIQIEIPERFQQNIERDTTEPTVFGQDLEKRLFVRNFQKATLSYAQHIAMVNDGYRVQYEAKYSHSA